MNISISISNKIATITSPTYAVCDNTDYTCVFTFDSEWTAYTTKTARFAFNGGHYDAVFTGNTVTMPKIENADMVLIGVFAGDLHTTTPAKLPMVRSILHSKGGVICPSDHVYDQVLEQLNHKVTEPTTEGTSGQVLTTDGQGGRSWTTCEGTTDHSQLDHLAYADSGHTGFQPTIDDLATIRNGAALGATALQSVPDTYRTSAAQDVIDATKASSSDLENTDRSLEALWELNKGQTWDFDTDAETVYSKTIPSGSRYASVDSIGGRSVVWKQIRDNGTDLKIRTLDNSSGTTTQYIVWISNAALVSGNKYFFEGVVESNLSYIYCTRAVTQSNLINGGIITSNYTGASAFYGAVPAGLNGYMKFHDRIVDITAWFGAGNEPTLTTDPKMREVYAYLEAHPEYNAGTILHGAVTSVEVKDADAVVTKTEQIPAAVQALTGYGQSSGTSVNYIDFGEKKYHCFGSYVDGAWVAQAETITDISSLLTDGFLTSMQCEADGSVTFKQSGTQLQVPVQNTFLVKLSEVE